MTSLDYVLPVYHKVAKDLNIIDVPELNYNPSKFKVKYAAYIAAYFPEFNSIDINMFKISCIKKGWIKLSDLTGEQTYYFKEKPLEYTLAHELTHKKQCDQKRLEIMPGGLAFRFEGTTYTGLNLSSPLMPWEVEANTAAVNYVKFIL